MSSMIMSTNILPLARFKATASEVLNGMKRDGRPVVITQNGEAAAVLVPPEEYDRLAYRAEFLASVERGYADSEAGRLIDSGDLAAELRTRYEKEAPAMKKFRVRWTERARLDLIDIGDYIALRNPAAAATFTDELIRRADALSDNPRIGRAVPEIAREDVRELLHGSYRIVYRIIDSEVHILTVFEGHKRLDAKGFTHSIPQ